MTRPLAIAILAMFALAALVTACERVVELSPTEQILPDAPPDAPDVDAAPPDALDDAAADLDAA
jgi:hypothetical protein